MKLTLALFFATVVVVAAQTPQVPHKMQFANLTLTIRDDARKEIQQDVDAYTRYPKSFDIKVERARTYFPIIEKIFAEENVPDDFKFLVIQESALIPDAVSVSNAVGFWQFKDFTAIEMGLRVDKEVDERMNIVSSTRAAAGYLKKNNKFFDNWLYALQAYQMGAGGVMRSEKDTKGGARQMEITSKTYWYVKKYLAHKIAYEGAIKGEGQVKVMTYANQGKRSLNDISREMSVPLDDLKEYNKWLKSFNIPSDKTYAVAIPVKGATPVQLPEAISSPAVADASKGLQDTAVPEGSSRKSPDRRKINGIVAIKAEENETPAKLASRAAVDLSAFLKWNEISISDRLVPGEYYFLGKKRVRATTAYHKVTPGETLWMISQKHGVQVRKLKRFNRLQNENDIAPGMTLWLASMKPKASRETPQAETVIEVDKEEAFNWEVSAKSDLTKPNTRVPVDEPVTKTEAQAPETIVVVPTSNPEESTALEPDSNIVEEERHESTETLPVEEKPAAAPHGPSEQIGNTVNSPLITEHTVQSKETLYAIARKYSVGVMDLVKWNDLDLQQGLKIGQTLKVSAPQQVADAGEAAAKEEIEHVVKPSDTVYSIARKYGVTIKELMDWNNKKDFNLSVGEKLTVRPR